MGQKLPFTDRFLAGWPPTLWCDLTVLLAVSGGADSVAMLRLMTSLAGSLVGQGRGRLVVAHFNHHLRAKAADRDQQFVESLSQELGIECRVGHSQQNHDAAKTNRTAEEIARDLRYEFLQKTAEQLGARYLVTAHTSDDQAETILHRIVRGTGLTGLAGMVRARPLGPGVTLIRPLLEFRRSELIDYLKYLGQPYRHDATNDDTCYTRNRIRHTLIPQLANDYNSNVVGALLRLGSLAQEAEEVIDLLVAQRYEQCVQPDRHGLQIDAALLEGDARYVVRQLFIAIWRRQDWPLQAMGFAEWDLLADMVMAVGDDMPKLARKTMFPGAIVAEIGEHRLLLYQ